MACISIIIIYIPGILSSLCWCPIHIAVPGDDGAIAVTYSDYSVGHHFITISATDSTGRNAVEFYKFFTHGMDKLACSKSASLISSLYELQCRERFTNELELVLPIHIILSSEFVILSTAQSHTAM